MKTTWDELLKAEEARLKGLLRYRSPQLPEFQIPSELPTIIPTESKTPSWVKHISPQDAEELKQAEVADQQQKSKLAGVVGEPSQFRSKMLRTRGRFQ